MATSPQTESARGLAEFVADQKSFSVGGITVGGRPGVRPAVLVGSIFYHGHKVIIDENKGEFDRDDAERRIRAKEAFAKKTGNPCMLDVVGATPEAIRRHVEFVAGVTDMPFLVDGTTTEVRQAGMEYAAEAGLMSRVVYNSIQPEVSDAELNMIRELGVETALVLTYYLDDFTAKGRVESVRQLLPKLEDAGVRQVMVDTCVIDLATLGQGCSAMVDIKNEFGLPVGGGVHNAVAMWHGLKEKMGPEAKKPCTASASAAAIMVGADFVLYGPIEDAGIVFPAVAMVDTALSQLAMERGESPPDDHPRYLIG